MSKMNQLTHNERVFLAGTIRSIILANEQMDDAELSDLEKLFKKLQLDDFEQCLDEFEEKVVDEKDFFQMAKSITNSNSRDIILGSIYELLIQDGLLDDSEGSVFFRLTELWQPKEESSS